MAPFISRLVCVTFYREARCVCSRSSGFLNKLFRHRNSSHRYGDQRKMSYISPFPFFLFSSPESLAVWKMRRCYPLSECFAPIRVILVSRRIYMKTCNLAWLLRFYILPKTPSLFFSLMHFIWFERPTVKNTEIFLRFCLFPVIKDRGAHRGHVLP